ncbi:carboxymuconolactone decarboxylase family protein [Lichenifustis flavocetrariae]|uniref:Peroxidase-related enzyme n=1 Tax=Lichenifustis flavocetrariae TaxID=2949735 RepID=A0AA41YZT1_9HYPH|nr:peroxidase-related enzyme [Lichenifustis flavocetrariae]MCW6511579.1 peroxidase-related enzyme [Lichenifustis flavocetrariae]
MSRIPTPATITDAPEKSRGPLEAVHKQLGVVPNMFRLIGASPQTLEGYLGLSGALGKGALPAATRERIALAVAEVNGCDYCLSAHTYLAKNVVHLNDAEITANRSGASNDLKANAAVHFAAQLTRERGHIQETELLAVREAGYTDAQILEIIAHVALNTFTNMVNEALKTEIDFPKVNARNAA